MGPYLGTPNTEKDSEDGESPAMRWGATSMQGWRKSQEDSHIANTNLPDGCSVFAVFDGHGGKEVSLWVKDVFCPELIKLDEYKQKNYGAALSICFRKMDTMLLEPEGKAKLKELQGGANEADVFQPMREDENPAQYTGCTAVVVLISPTHIFCANAGDSRSVLARSSGDPAAKCFALSDDHKPDNLEEKARIEAAGGFVEENRVNGSLNLSRSLGDFEYKSSANLDFKLQMVTCDPEVRSVARQASDQFLILACDGIWDCLTSEECVA